MKYMDNKDMAALIALIIGGLSYSIISFSYMHSNFTTKSEQQLILGRLDRIALKIDHISERMEEGRK